MALNLHLPSASNYHPSPEPLRLSYADASVVLMVNDLEESRLEMKSVLELNGYRVIDTDNGQDAAKWTRLLCPDLLLVDLDVPLIYEMVAARQIVKKAQLGVVPVVIVSRDYELGPAEILELGVRCNEYVTRFLDYEQLERLLDYLLPAAARDKGLSACSSPIVHNAIVSNKDVPHARYTTYYEQRAVSTASTPAPPTLAWKTQGAGS